MISTVTYNGDGATRVFPVAFEIKGEDYVVVWLDNIAVNDRTKYDIINNSVVFNVGEEPPIGSNNVQITVASSPTEIADLNAPPSTVQVVVDNIVGLGQIVEQIVPNITEILQADTNAATATSAANAAIYHAGNALTYATNAQTSFQSALAQAELALAYKNSASTSATNASNSATTASTNATTAITQAGITTTKAAEASASATTALTAKNSVEVVVEVLNDELSKGRYVDITYPNIFYNDTDSGIKFYYTENDISTSTFVSTLTAATASEFVDKINSTSTITILGFSAVFSSPLGVDTIQLRHTYNKSITSTPYAYTVKDGVENSMYPFANGAYSEVAITGQNISSVNTVALNIDEILQADTNASIATTKAAEANASVIVCQSIASGVLHLGALDLGLVSDTNTYFPTDLGGL